MPGSPFNENYYERGVESGVSGYSNYRWVPELTIPMAARICELVPIMRGAPVLDFGCAKGFLVKAMRLLGRQAFGVDVSEYAVGQADLDIGVNLEVIDGAAPVIRKGHFPRLFHTAIAKDVLEHVPYENLDRVLAFLASVSVHLLVIVPLGDGKKFVIPAYEHDVTHVIRQPSEWWQEQIRKHFPLCVVACPHVSGIKENWYSIDPLGNAVIHCRRS